MNFKTSHPHQPSPTNQKIHYWSSIRSYTRLGSVQGTLNFYFDKMLRDLVKKILTKIIEKQIIKINYIFGLVFQNIKTQRTLQVLSQ